MSFVADLCERLVAVLESEEDLYRELRDVLQRERELLVTLDAIAFEALVRRKEALAEEGRLLEESRVAVARELVTALGVAADPLPALSDLCTRIGPEGDRLRDAQSRLRALVGATRELLDANASSTGDALAQVRATLRMLGRVLPLDPVYGPRGMPTPEEASSGRLVRQTA